MFVNGDCMRNYLSNQLSKQNKRGGQKPPNNPHTKHSRLPERAKAGTPHIHTGIANSGEKTDCNSNPRCTGVVDTATELKWNEICCCKADKTKHHAPNLLPKAEKLGTQKESFKHPNQNACV